MSITPRSAGQPIPHTFSHLPCPNLSRPGFLLVEKAGLRGKAHRPHVAFDASRIGDTLTERGAIIVGREARNAAKPGKTTDVWQAA